MSDRRFDVIFRGDVVPGQSLLDVKQRLTELFDAPPARVEQMFSGRPVVIKSDLDEEAAVRYKVALQDAGALVDIRPVEPVSAREKENNSSDEKVQSPDRATDRSSGQQVVVPQSSPENSKAGETIGIAPVGADVLLSEYRRDFTPREVDTSYMAVEEPGTDVLKDNEKSPIVKRDVDTSHLSVEDPE